MSIILGLEPDSKQTISPELAARGMNRIRCTLSELRAWAVPTAVQLAFKTYTSLLPAYIHAVVDKVNADLRDPCHPISLKLKDSIPFPYPPICVTPTRGGSEIDQKLLDLGGVLNIIRKEKVFEFKTPTAEFFKAIGKLNISETSQAVDQSINMSALTTFKLTNRIFSGFLILHRYPAYRDSDHFWSIAVDTDMEWEMGGTTGAKRKRHEGDDAGSVAKQRKEAAGSIVPAHADLPAINPSTDRGHDAIARIKTIPERAHTPWATSVDQLPQTDGLFIPYHPQLFFFDIFMAPRVIAKHFIGCLGSSKEGCLKTMEKVKGDWGVLGKTDVGKILSHLAFCIDLAIQAQARVVPLILNGRYTGVFFSGSGYSVSIDGTLYAPTTFDKVAQAIEESTTHSKILGEILVLLGKSGDINDGMSDIGKIVKDQSFTSMSLRSLCLSSKVTVDDKAKILELAKALDFRHVRFGVNANHIAEALKLISDVPTPLPSTLPIHSSMLFETDRLKVVWSCFGFTAPTFLPVGGTHINLTDKTYEVSFRRGTETVTETKPFDCLHIRLVHFENAIEDLERVRKEGKVAILRTVKRDAKFSERSFDRADFTKIKEGLDKLANVQERKKVAAEVVPDVMEVEVDEDDYY
jgi:hypothetical protein